MYLKKRDVKPRKEFPDLLIVQYYIIYGYLLQLAAFSPSNLFKIPLTASALKDIIVNRIDVRQL